jgi:hypothetical protein
MLSYSSAVPQPETIADVWKGETVIFGHTVHLVFRVSACGSGFATVFDCIEPGFLGVAVRETVFEQGRVRFDLDVVGAVFLGALNPKTGVITGSLIQGAFASPVTLAREPSNVVPFRRNRKFYATPSLLEKTV